MKVVQYEEPEQWPQFFRQGPKEEIPRLSGEAATPTNTSALLICVPKIERGSRKLCWKVGHAATEIEISEKLHICDRTL